MANDVRITSASTHGHYLIMALNQAQGIEALANVCLVCKDGRLTTSGFLLASVSPVVREVGKVWCENDSSDLTILLPDFTASEAATFLQYLTSTEGPTTSEDIKAFTTILDFLGQVSPKVRVNDQLSQALAKQTEASFWVKDLEDLVQDSDIKDEDNGSSDDFFDEPSKPSRTRNTTRSSSKTQNKKASCQGTLADEVLESFDDERRVFVCKHCGIERKRSDRLAAHLKWHLDHPGEEYQTRNSCKICGRFNATYFMLKVHMKRMHSDMPKQFRCDHEGCAKAFRVSFFRSPFALSLYVISYHFISFFVSFSLKESSKFMRRPIRKREISFVQSAAKDFEVKVRSSCMELESTIPTRDPASRARSAGSCSGSRLT